MLRLLKNPFLCTVCIWTAACTQPTSDSAYIEAAEREVIAVWLSGQPNLRIATDEDCECEEDLKDLRKASDEVGYRPYYARGDFNGDQVIDFAVVLFNQRTKKPDLLAIFNGPYRTGTQPAYTTPLNGALFFKPQNPVPHRLLVGAFFSEGTFLVPKGSTYLPAEEEAE